MTRSTPITLGVALAFTCALATSAFAITGSEDPGTENPPSKETPVTETPVTETPVTETPVTENPVTENPREQPLTKEVKKPTKETPKQVVVVPRNKVETMIYPVPSKHNFCPQGLQPVTISGVISCGSPNKAVTYNQMLRHPKPVRVHKPRKTYHRSAVPTCTPGLKGCSDR